jgi:hypothetical protein
MVSLNSSTSVLSSLVQNLVTDLHQIFSILPAPKVQAAVEKASPKDIAELSDQALRLQQAGALFGNLDGAQPAGLDPIDQALVDSTLSTGATASSAGDSPAPLLDSLYGATPAVDPPVTMLG